MLPEMAIHAAAGDLDAFARSTRWALDRMALLVIPVSPGSSRSRCPRCASSRSAARARPGPGLLAAGLASLAIGLYPYGAFLLLARSWYALGDSRTPAIVAIGSALLGVAMMIVGSQFTHGARARRRRSGSGTARRISSGAIVLGVGCRAPHRDSRSCPTLLPISIAIAGRDRARVVDRAARARSAAAGPRRSRASRCVGGIGTGVYVLAVRRWWRAPEPIASRASDAARTRSSAAVGGRARRRCSMLVVAASASRRRVDAAHRRHTTTTVPAPKTTHPGVRRVLVISIPRRSRGRISTSRSCRTCSGCSRRARSPTSRARRAPAAVAGRRLRHDRRRDAVGRRIARDDGECLELDEPFDATEPRARRWRAASACRPSTIPTIGDRVPRAARDRGPQRRPAVRRRR